MKSNELLHIQYEKSTKAGSGEIGEITERYVIPTFIPAPNIKALDVTSLSEDERTDVATKYAAYSEYYRTQAKTIFKFEDWLAHTNSSEIATDDLKWRTFKLDNVTILD